MKEANGAVANDFIFEETRIAARVKRNIGGKLDVRRAPKPLKTFHAGVKRCETTLGKTHNCDSRRINSGMPGKQVQPPVCVDNHRKTGELGLVRNRLGDPAPRKCIQDEGGDAHGVESLCPSIDVCADTTRPMDENHSRNAGHSRR